MNFMKIVARCFLSISGNTYSTNSC